jgi:hypothetical protein
MNVKTSIEGANSLTKNALDHFEAAANRTPIISADLAHRRVRSRRGRAGLEIPPLAASCHISSSA